MSDKGQQKDSRSCTNPESTAYEDKATESTAQSSSSKSPPRSKWDSPPPPRPASPEPNCSICLGELQNKSFTNGCFHTFCFTCLLEWSKVRAVCPLCKQKFKSIIHNVRSIEDYDQYEIRDPEAVSRYPVPEELTTGGRFRYRTTLTNNRWMQRQLREQSRQLDLLQRPSRLTATSSWRRIRQTATSEFRRRVYEEGLRVQEVELAPGRPTRQRNITPAFLRRNPACSHRLVPWLNRELNVLLANSDDQVQLVLELVLDIIQRFEIGGEIFRAHLEPFLGRRTDHFVHEFIYFARSPYDLCLYDRNASYEVNPESVDPLSILTVDSSSESEEEDNNNNLEDPDIVILSPTEYIQPSVSGDHSYFSLSSDEPPAVRTGLIDTINFDPTPAISVTRGRTYTFLSGTDFTEPGNSGWESPMPGPSTINWSPPHPISPTDNMEITAIDSQRTEESIRSINPEAENGNHKQNGESDDEELLVTGYEKAIEERTPEINAISSSEDEELKAALEAARIRQKAEANKLKEEEKKRREALAQSRRQRRESSSSNSRSRSRSRSRNLRCKDHSRSRNRHGRSRSRDIRSGRQHSRDRDYGYHRSYQSSHGRRRHRSGSSDIEVIGGRPGDRYRDRRKDDGRRRRRSHSQDSIELLESESSRSRRKRTRRLSDRSPSPTRNDSRRRSKDKSVSQKATEPKKKEKKKALPVPLSKIKIEPVDCKKHPTGHKGTGVANGQSTETGTSAQPAAAPSSSSASHTGWLHSPSHVATYPPDVPPSVPENSTSNQTQTQNGHAGQVQQSVSSHGIKNKEADKTSSGKKAEESSKSKDRHGSKDRSDKHSSRDKSDGHHSRDRSDRHGSRDRSDIHGSRDWDRSNRQVSRDRIDGHGSRDPYLSKDYSDKREQHSSNRHKTSGSRHHENSSRTYSSRSERDRFDDRRFSRTEISAGSGKSKERELYRKSTSSRKSKEKDSSTSSNKVIKKVTTAGLAAELRKAAMRAASNSLASVNGSTGNSVDLHTLEKSMRQNIANRLKNKATEKKN